MQGSSRCLAGFADQRQQDILDRHQRSPLLVTI
jgi:hypothetical protein